ncbi:hypothetical protein QFC22_006258 [Naganishia vaughanmartiniae]|uniref:Uncharacterized protein n=1 Tax=Naganishia vaughanmartiniae TaxID=1424756 RepID=A0ACC2WL97_9TREE|nr:hypothetical protein QFC22_006258 [Naganishia vaughanmartiniae]
MPSLLARKRITVLALSLALIAFYLPPITHQLRVFGILSRPSDSLGNTHSLSSANVRIIRGTEYCEDLHLHGGSGLLVTACEGEQEDRRGWFPPLGIFDRPPVRGGPRGSLVVVDPQTFTAKTLELRGYDDIFVTHGIDIVDDPEDPTAIYIHAVNHAPATSSPSSPSPSAPPGPHLAASRIEVFHHTLTTSYATHIRTISHPLIRTPNDILSLSPTEILVTNDHRYKSGFMRHVEDVVTHPWAPKTDIVRLVFDLGVTGEGKGVQGVEASVVLDAIHNGNGLGHGPAGEVVIGDAAGGVLHLANLIPPSSPTTTDSSTSTSTSGTPRLQIHQSIPLLSTIDNPSFYTSPEGTKSGYILAGLSKGASLGPNARDRGYKHPVVVWYVPLLADGDAGVERIDGNRRVGQPHVLFADDGGLISTASAAVIVDRPSAAGEGEGVERWLFVTGFMSDAMIAVKVDL